MVTLDSELDTTAHYEFLRPHSGKGAVFVMDKH